LECILVNWFNTILSDSGDIKDMLKLIYLLALIEIPIEQFIKNFNLIIQKELENQKKQKIN